MRRLLLPGAVAALPGPAWGHASERGVVLLLPTVHYLWAGAAAVAVSFAVLALLRPGRVRQAFRRRRIARLPGLRIGPVVSVVAAAVFLALVAAGFLGSRNPLRNPLPLAVWTFWWAGLVLAAAVLGDLWRWLNPWSAPMAALRRAGLRPLLGLPGWLGCATALAWFAAFAWFALVDSAPDDPGRLALAALIYWAATLGAMILFGEAVWRRRGEPFAILFRLLARLAPLRRRGRSLTAALPGTGAGLPPGLRPGTALLLLMLLGTVTFDGFRETFLWLSLIGINPLEFPGRSAVVGANTAGLALCWAAIAGSFALAVAAGLRLARVGGRFQECFGRLAMSLLPIALGYHFAHYLAQMLVYGQHMAVAATDPLGTGADLLGLGPHFVSTSFLYDPHAVETIWQLQSGAIVAGHVVAVAVARRASLDLHASPRDATLAELPLAALMVLYTLLGLWLLSTPIA